MKTGQSAGSDVYRSAFLAAATPCLLVRPNEPLFTIEAANQAYARLLDRSPEELVGRGLFESYPQGTDATTERLRASLHHLLQGRQPDALPIHRYGPAPSAGDTEAVEERYWGPRNSPIFDTDGNVCFILHQIDDCTEEMLSSIERSRFEDVASELLVKVGFDGYFQHVNTHCEEVLGWSQDELLSVPWLDFVHPEDADSTLTVLERALAGQAIHQFENRYRCKDGSYRWLSWNTLTATDQRALYCSAADVTLSRLLRSVAEGQKHALELSVHGAELPVVLERIIRTLDNHANNGVYASILLLSDDGQHLLTGAAPGLPEAFTRAIHGMRIGVGEGSCGTVAATGKMYVAENIAEDPYWDKFRELALANGLQACWCVPITSSLGEVLGTFALYYAEPTRPSAHERQLVDIVSRTAGVVIERERTLAARRKSERQILKARNEAEAANLAKSDFLANISHEIRTPMNVVVGVSNILSQHEELNPEQADLVRTLQQSAKSLLELIDDLLDISRIEAHSLVLEHVSFRMQQLLDDVSDVIRPRAEEKGLAFEVSELPISEARFIGDPARLRQAILNLCSNAIKFTQSGSIRLTVSYRKDENPDIALVSVTVTDTGIGIEKSKQQAIFHKFTQADSSITRKFGGTGLGLSITKQLVEVMDGSIAVESRPGEGAAFTFTVPLRIDKSRRVPPAEGASIPDEASIDQPPRPVLLVEDFKPNALITARYLRVFGYQYDLVDNGRDAVEKGKSGAYAVILMDVQMPDLDGIEATRRIRAYERAHGLQPTPIIAVTAHAMGGDRLRCLEAGMDDYLLKPFAAPDLKEKLAQFAKVEKP